MSFSHFTLLIAGFLLALPSLRAAAGFTPISQQFTQEVAHRYMHQVALTEGPISLVEVLTNAAPRAFAQGRWFELSGNRWVPVAQVPPCAANEFRFVDAAGQPVRVELPWADVQQLVRAGPDTYLATAKDPFKVSGGRLSALGWPSRMRVNQIALGPDGALRIASSDGLFQQVQGGWAPVRIADGLGRTWAAEQVLGVAFDSAGRMWFATRAGVGQSTAEGWRFFEGKDGLPWNDFTGITAGPEGTMWFGTHLGALRFDGAGWHYRQGPAWLPNDDVRSIAVDSQGNAWFATAEGVGEIARMPMTLAEKAAFYENEIAHHIKRTPFGFVAEAPLRTPGDKNTANPQDSDNDGLWTAMYGAGECFAVGATGDAAAKTRAKQAFEALRFLQTVTQGGSPAPPKGYVARTVRPVEWPDPNVGRLERDREDQKGDALWKAYEPRWPKSADGKWYWKSDTSSDELDGHYFFYPLYFDLCADTPAEKDRVREVVRDLTDHLLSHNFTLTDVDGTPTRWAVYGPQFLNRDPRWWAERGLNSLSILSYLAVAEHITGDPKYAAAARELIDQHGYAQNLMFPKVQSGAGSGNHSDDEMAFMCFYNLMRYSKDAALKNQVRYTFFAYWANEAPERNPFFNFAFAPFGLGQSITNVWGVYPVTPWDGWLEDSRSTLEGLPLDRLDWPRKNSHRLDVVLLPRHKSKDLYEPQDRGRGHLVGGKVLPVENRHFNHWNTDPWDLDYGGRGGELGAGTVFLLPYYMGLYEGYIEKP